MDSVTYFGALMLVILGIISKKLPKIIVVKIEQKKSIDQKKMVKTIFECTTL